MSKCCSERGKIVEAECVHEGGKFILCNSPEHHHGACDLFTVRLRAPADYQAGDVFVFRGKELSVLTPEMQSAPAGVFRAGAVVHADIDLACGRTFVGAGGSGGGSGAETDPVYTADKPSLARLASPTFVGIPKAPTAPAGTATTQLATTEFVATAIEEAGSAPSAAFAMVPDYANMETVNRISTNNGTWTANKDGFVQLFGSSGNRAANVSWIYMYVNNVTVLFSKDVGYAVVPVKAGDVVSIKLDPVFVAASCYYIPPKYIPVNRQYSTDEQLTGETWIDGKFIWKRTISFTSSSVENAWNSVANYGHGYFSQLIKVEGVQQNSDGNWAAFPLAAVSSSVTATTAVQINPTTGDVEEYHSGLSGSAHILTLFYTKP